MALAGALGALFWAGAALADGTDLPSPSAQCTAAIAQAETGKALPSGMLGAIGRVESGVFDPARRSVQPWPWTIDAGGVGHVFATKEDAVAAVRSLQESGVRSIDVGCLQVNLMYHPDAFASLEDAFDPQANAQYAARFLRQLFHQTASWAAAIADYHSQTADIGADYQRRVLAAWTGPAAALARRDVAAAQRAPIAPQPVTAYAAFAPPQTIYAAFLPKDRIYGAFAQPAPASRAAGPMIGSPVGGVRRRAATRVLPAALPLRPRHAPGQFLTASP